VEGARQGDGGVSPVLAPPGSIARAARTRYDY
jgi:hypothetical protein